MQQHTVLNEIKAIKERKDKIVEAIKTTTSIALITSASNQATVLKTDNCEIDITEDINNKIIEVCNNNKKNIKTSLMYEDVSDDNNEKLTFYLVNGQYSTTPQFTKIDNENLRKQLCDNIRKTKFSTGKFNNISIDDYNKIHFSLQIDSPRSITLNANIITDSNGKIENIKLSYVDDVLVKNDKQLKELNELLNKHIHTNNEPKINIENVHEILNKLAQKENSVNINKDIKDKFNFIYGTLQNINDEQTNITKEMEGLQHIFKVSNDIMAPVNSYAIQLKAIPQYMIQYKKQISEKISDIEKHIDSYCEKLIKQNGNTEEEVAKIKQNMKTQVKEKEIGIGSQGTIYKHTDNKIVHNNIEVQLNKNYQIEYLSFIDNTTKQSVKILPNIQFKINNKILTLEDCVLHHNAGFGAELNGDGGRNGLNIKINNIKQLQSIKRQQKKFKEQQTYLKKTNNWKTDEYGIYAEFNKQKYYLQQIKGKGEKWVTEQEFKDYLNNIQKKKISNKIVSKTLQQNQNNYQI